MRFVSACFSLCIFFCVGLPVQYQIVCHDVWRFVSFLTVQNPSYSIGLFVVIIRYQIPNQC